MTAVVTKLNASQALANLVRDPEAMSQLHRAAERELLVPRGSPAAKDVVADAIMSTLEGGTPLDPAHLDRPEDLLSVLMGTVRREARRHRSIVAAEVPLELADAWVEMPAPGTDHTDMRPCPAELPQLLQAIEARAAADPTVLQLITLLRRHRALRRKDARRLMTAHEYREARSRLHQYALDAAAALHRATEHR